MTLRAVLFPLFLVLAVICFVLATTGVSFPRVNLVALGLAIFAAAHLVSRA